MLSAMADTDLSDLAERGDPLLAAIERAEAHRVGEVDPLIAALEPLLAALDCGPSALTVLAAADQAQKAKEAMRVRIDLLERAAVLAAADPEATEVLLGGDGAAAVAEQLAAARGFCAAADRRLMD